jgi:hypothetical protein
MFLRLLAEFGAIDVLVALGKVNHIHEVENSESNLIDTVIKSRQKELNTSSIVSDKRKILLVYGAFHDFSGRFKDYKVFSDFL